MKSVTIVVGCFVLACCLAVSRTATRALAQAAQSPVRSLGNFSHIVANMDRSVEFYRDGLGLELSQPLRPFDANEAIMRLGNIMGAQTRYTALKVPGSAMGLELIEYKDIDRQPARPRFQDPGATTLSVSVRDLDATMARLKKSGGRVITVSGEPAEIGGRSRIVFMQDPDGFVIELGQSLSSPLAASETPGNVLGASLELTIGDTDRTIAFYRDLLGLQPTVGQAFNGDKVMADTAGTPGAQFRQSRLQVPGTSDVVRLIEFKNIDRKPLGARLQDPGMAMLQVMVRDVDSLLKTLKAGGAAVVTIGGEPVNMGPLRIAVVRDPNNLFLELIQRPPS
jgi:catechol 2,3-dioxygenase-like lactoylglutathione lyase family enzyme